MSFHALKLAAALLALSLAPALAHAQPGALDRTFGSGGVVTTTIGASASAQALVLQPDGMLVAAGWTSDGTNATIALVRYQANGTIDGGFGVGGFVLTSVGTTSRANALVRQPDGALVVAGTTGTGSGADFVVARYDASGVLDPSFGTGGIVVTAISAAGDGANALARQPDGML